MATRSLNARHWSGNKEMQNMMTIASSIAHELRNYMMGISICTELSENRLNDICNICTEISGKELKNIRQRVKTAGYLISNLQLQMKSIITGKSSNEDFKRYSMIKNIQEALEQYPFDMGERELVTVEAPQDFDYVGNSILTNIYFIT